MRWPSGSLREPRLDFGEVPCAECGRRQRGLSWGERCPDCTARRLRRARRVARGVSLLATVLVALWLRFGLRLGPGEQWYAVVAIVATFALTRHVALKVAMEYLP